jgi:hypothetical protein
MNDSTSLYRKADPPALGPAFGHTIYDPELIEFPGGATLMFDLSKLNLSDYRTMRSHPQINASLSLMTFMIHEIDWHIKCERQDIADVVEENMRLIWTRLVRAFSASYWAGFSPCVLEWENAENGKYIFVSKVKDIPPEEAEVNWKEVQSSYRPPGKVREYRPNKVKVFDGIKKDGLNYPIPPEHSFWYPLLMENGNMYGRKLLRSAFQPWYFSIIIHLFANRYFERFGEPVPIGRAPFDDEFNVKAADGTDAKMSGKQAMEQILLRLRSRGVVVLPSDRDITASGAGGRSEYLWDIEYLESQMRGADFERYLARLDEEISLSIFTPTLLMRSGDVGSHNLGVQHTQTWLWSLNSLAMDLKDYIDRYIVERIKAYNFTPNAPKCEWVPRKLGKDNPETIRAVITELVRNGSSGAKVDLNELGQALGMTLTEVREVQEDTPGPAVDDRQRTERDRSGDGSRRVGEPLATSREITARVKGQVQKAWKEDRFGEGFAPSMGFRRRFQESLESEGWGRDEAIQQAESLYSRMENWMETAVALGKEEFSSPNDFMSLFERRLTTEIESLEAH